MGRELDFYMPKMRRVEHIHFVGIGGAGMCGIAEVLHNEGYHVTGSDLSENRSVEHLRSLGIQVFLGHQAEHIHGANVVVRSTAVNADNPEIMAAVDQTIPIIPRAAMLAELMRFRYGIAIAGTHGKTTTTSLVSSLLNEGGLDPSFVIGGKLNSCASNAQLGKSSYFVVEADESDASFLFLKPMMSVVTNIDADHMGTYDNSFDRLRTTFVEFLHHLPFYGLAVLCLEDEEVRRIIPLVQRPIATYGFHEEAHYRAVDWTQLGLQSEFTVHRPRQLPPLRITFACPGRHNVLNALAAIAIATELGVQDDAIVSGLTQFQGVGRRFQILGERKFEHGTAIVLDDYGHHPQEISSTIDAFRCVWPHKKLVHVFQPHRYTRTQSLFDRFVEVLSMADTVLLMDIYSAGEAAIPGVSSALLIEQIKQKHADVHWVNDNNLVELLNQVVTDDSVVLMQGAGNVGQLAQNLMLKTVEPTKAID